MWRRPSFATVLIGKSVLLREGLSRILRTANFRIQGSVSCADDLIPSTLQRHQPLFLIIHTGNDFDSTVEQIELLREHYPNGRIAIVADHYRLSELVSAFRAGANGYLLDVTTCDAFIKSIELVMIGQTIFLPALLSFARNAESASLGETEPRRENDRAILLKKEDATADEATAEEATAPQLSPREKTILRCLIEGDTNKCIARKIDIAEATVKVHVKAILRKIRVQNRTQAAIWAMNNGPLTHSKDKSPPAISEAGKRPPSPGGAIAEAPAQLCVVTRDTDQVEIARIDDHLIHSRVNGTALGTGRLGK
jgi:two-component system, NarL family, nitrate/nitrite response regulator NarL